MAHLLESIGVALAAFVSTNLDDIFLLIGLFSDRQFRPRQVVAGQFLGIGLLFVVATGCALMALTVPGAWLGLLGFVPVFLGVVRLRAARRDAGPGGSDNAAPGDPRPRTGRWSDLPVAAIAAVTVANGGDNLGVYIPVFATRLRQLAVVAGVFAVMTGLWCAAAFWLTHHPRIGARVRRFGGAVLPFVLIALGLSILSRALPLLR